jgi:uncharacterized protein (DUF1697 family)
MKTFVALLRGINVGGRSEIPMGELRSALSSLGLEDVATYIRSGNVVFRSTGAARAVAADIERQIAETFGIALTVLIRTPAELASIAKANPFVRAEADPSRLHVVFLARAATAKTAARLDPERSPPDEFSVRGREIYLRLPNGAGRSKLTTDYFERQLGIAATARNWNTLIKLLALTQR